MDRADEHNGAARDKGPRPPLRPFRVGDALHARRQARGDLNLDDLFKNDGWKDAIPRPKKIRRMIRRFERTVSKLQTIAKQQVSPALAQEAQRCLAAYEKVLNQLRELEELRAKAED